MISPPTIELQRQLHDERVEQLRSSMHRPWSTDPRRTVGAWLVSAGLWLAPDEPARRDYPGPSLHSLG
jgi:hypothetical protein